MYVVLHDATENSSEILEKKQTQVLVGFTPKVLYTFAATFLGC